MAIIILVSEVTPNGTQCINGRHGLEDGLRIWGTAWGVGGCGHLNIVDRSCRDRRNLVGTCIL